MTQTAQISVSEKPAAKSPAKTTAKEKIIKAARVLLLDKGYGAVSVEEIVSAAGVSKGSFYHFFKSKEDLGLAALKDFMEEGGEIMMCGTFGEIADPVTRAFGFLKHVEAKSEKLWNNGCLMVLFSVDMSGAHPKIRKQTEKILADIHETIGEVLAPLAKALEGGVKPSDLTHMYVSVIDGSIVYARATGDVGQIAVNLKTFRTQMETLVKKA